MDRFPLPGGFHGPPPQQPQQGRPQPPPSRKEGVEGARNSDYTFYQYRYDNSDDEEQADQFTQSRPAPVSQFAQAARRRRLAQPPALSKKEFLKNHLKSTTIKPGEANTCEICWDPYDDDEHAPVRIEVHGCPGHVFGHSCVLSWVATDLASRGRVENKTCPKCRAILCTTKALDEMNYTEMLRSYGEGAEQMRGFFSRRDSREAPDRDEHPSALRMATEENLLIRYQNLLGRLPPGYVVERGASVEDTPTTMGDGSAPNETRRQRPQIRRQTSDEHRREIFEERRQAHANRRRGIEDANQTTRERQRADHRHHMDRLRRWISQDPHRGNDQATSSTPTSALFGPPNFSRQTGFDPQHPASNPTDNGTTGVGSSALATLTRPPDWTIYEDTNDSRPVLFPSFHSLATRPVPMEIDPTRITRPPSPTSPQPDAPTARSPYNFPAPRGFQPYDPVAQSNVRARIRTNRWDVGPRESVDPELHYHQFQARHHAEQQNRHSLGMGVALDPSAAVPSPSRRVQQDTPMMDAREDTTVAGLAAGVDAPHHF